MSTMTETRTAAKWENAGAGPRQVKDVQKAINELRREGQSHDELSGVRGGKEHRTTLWSPFGPVRPEVAELDEGIKAKYGAQITRGNVRQIIADYQAVMAEASTSRPVVDERRTPDENRARIEAAEAAQRARIDAQEAADRAASWTQPTVAEPAAAPPAPARRGRRGSPERAAEIEAKKAEIERAAENVNRDDPDLGEFLRRWSGRYSESNLLRLWVQCPGATCLHKFRTWQGMGRQVRTGAKAIYLMQPRTSLDPEKVSAANPEGKVFHGASWMALFDYAQTDLIGEFTEEAAPDVDPDLVAACKRLRMEAANLHPDRGGTPEAFMTAWARYEAAKARLKG